MSRPPRRQPSHSPALSSLPYEVEMTATAEAVYKDLYRKCKEAELRGDPASSHCTTFHIVRDAITRIIPHDPLNRKHALRGELSNIFRLKKGRLRICWIASSKQRRVCVLLLTEALRKEGDANDPYVIFQGRVSSGKLDSIFEEFGTRMSRLRNPK